MSAKTITLLCPQAAREQLASILHQYAEAAYPPGGSECGQVARAALQDAANTISGSAGMDSVNISRRLKPQLKAAINFHSTQVAAGTGTDYSARAELLLSMLSGQEITGLNWQQAQQSDAG